MTEAQAIEAIVGQFVAQWTTLQPATPIDLSNESASAADQFVSVTVTHTGAQQITTGPPGTRRVVRSGYAMVKIWTPGDKGTQLASQLADSARTALECVDIPVAGAEPITLLAGQTQEIGVDGRWYMSLVRFPFRYYATV